MFQLMIDEKFEIVDHGAGAIRSWVDGWGDGWGQRRDDDRVLYLSMYVCMYLCIYVCIYAYLGLDVKSFLPSSEFVDYGSANEGLAPIR